MRGDDILHRCQQCNSDDSEDGTMVAAQILGPWSWQQHTSASASWRALGERNGG